jgi:hypothetical protein
MDLDMLMLDKQKIFKKEFESIIVLLMMLQLILIKELMEA